MSVSANPAKEEIRLRLFVIYLKKFAKRINGTKKALLFKVRKPLKNKASCLVEYRGFNVRAIDTHICAYCGLRTPGACSTREGPPDLHALSGSNPLISEDMKKPSLWTVFHVWWSIGDSNP